MSSSGNWKAAKTARTGWRVDEKGERRTRGHWRPTKIRGNLQVAAIKKYCSRLLTSRSHRKNRGVIDVDVGPDRIPSRSLSCSRVTLAMPCEVAPHIPSTGDGSSNLESTRPSRCHLKLFLAPLSGLPSLSFPLAAAKNNNKRRRKSEK